MVTESKRITIAIITSLLLYLSSPFFIAYFSFFWLLRYFLTIWKKIYHPQFGPLLGGLDSVMLNESPYITDQRLNTGYYVTVEGKIELEEFRTVVRNGLKKFGQENDESSRRLSQVLKTWAGYFVGEDEKNFKLEDHVRLLNVEELNERIQRQCDPKTTKFSLKKKLYQEHFTDDDLAQLNWTLLKVPYEVNTAPWEILLVHNPQPKPKPDSELETVKSGPLALSTRIETNDSKCTTVIIVRLHHCLSDGISTNSLFSHFLDQSQQSTYGRTLDFFDSSKVRRSGSWLQSITQNCTHFILGLPQFISHVLSCRASDWPPTFLPSNNNDTASGHAIAVEIPKEKVQRILKLFEDRKIKVTTVLYAALALSITEYFNSYKKKHRDRASLVDIPPYIFALNPIGEKRRNNELTNSLTMLGVRIPFGPGLTNKDPKSILNEIQESYSYETDSGIRHVAKMLVQLIGLLPSKLKPPLLALCKGVCLSQVPRFETPVTILGKPLTSVRASACEFPTLSCITLFSLGTTDKIQGSFVVTKELLESYDEAKALASCFEKKFDDLYHDLIHRSRPKS